MEKQKYRKGAHTTLDFKSDSFHLDKHSFRRYKSKILEYYGCSSFDKSARDFLYQKIYLLAKSHIKPKVIFNDCVDLLLVQKIELPKYNTIRNVILNTIRDYTISVLNQLTNSLLPDHITLLDELLSFMDDKAVYKLTSLKSFNHSIRPKAIKENAIELASIQDIHDQLLPIVKTLPLNTRGIEYFATTVLKSDIDKYLHLITFVVYQYNILHDALMDIFLKSIASFGFVFSPPKKREINLRGRNDRMIISVNTSNEMPYKYPQEKGWDVPKQKYKLRNCNQYSNSLKGRGRIDLWLDKEAIDNWYEEDQENLGD